jgi:trans-aconitate methyltransferase
MDRPVGGDAAHGLPVRGTVPDPGVRLVADSGMMQTSSDEKFFWDDAAREQAGDFYGNPPYDVTSVASRILAAHPHPRTGLDIGCGPGRLTNLIARTAPDLFVHAIDISGWALRRAAHAGPANTFYHKSNGRTIPGVIPRKIDLIWSVTVFQHIPPVAMGIYLSEVHTWLADDGVLIFTVAVSDEPPGPFFYPMSENALDHAMSSLVDRFDLVTVDYDVVNDWTWVQAQRKAP